MKGGRGSSGNSPTASRELLLQNFKTYDFSFFKGEKPVVSTQEEALLPCRHFRRTNFAFLEAVLAHEQSPKLALAA